MNWNKCVIAVVGGDRREQEIARCAAATGAQVRSFGFPWPDEGLEGVTRAGSLHDALSGTDVALFPIPGIAADGALFAPQSTDRIIPDAASLGAMRKPGHIVLGWADPKLKAHCASLEISLHEYEWDEDLMLLRGPAIVEGMLKVLIDNTDITIHKARICAVGHGTIGALVTRTLYALGAHVHVAARNPVQRAAAFAAGAEPHELGELPQLFPNMDIIISSVPSRVIGREMLELLPKSALLVDLAAPPGGIDHEAAKALGLKSLWARGLGARAPITVGRSQWGGVRRRVEAILKERA